MSSSVHFKFKSQKEPSRVTFDGTAISVFDLKREIITINRLGDGTDFELAIYNESDNTEYDDDTVLIPRSTSVIARRLPAIRPGRGGAARYVSGRAPVNAKHTTHNLAKANGIAAKIKGTDMNSAQTEEERVKAMFNLEGEQWRLKQQEMATEQRVAFGPNKGFAKKNVNIPEGEPPRGYVCYRCGKKGHWIQACPTNDDPNFEGKSRIKRTTGIPRSMLKTIDKSELENLDEATRQQMMINGDGEYVIAQTDEKEWKRHQEQVKASAAAQEKANRGDQELQSRGLECPIDKRLFVDPVKTPCCQRTYCNECISTALIESDLTCPGCSTENVTLEELVPDTESQLKADAYRAEKAAEKKHETESKSEGSSSGVKSGTSSRSGSISPASGSSDGKVGSKKRGADKISDSKTLALSAPELKRQRSGEGISSSNALAQKSQLTPVVPPTTAISSLPFNQMMPPDMSQMMQNMGNQPVNFSMPMPMAGMPFMPSMNMNMNMNMNMMNPAMMGMAGNFMPSNFAMNPMNGMGGMNFMPGMNFPTNLSNGAFPQPANNLNMNGNTFNPHKAHPNHHHNSNLQHHHQHHHQQQQQATGPTIMAGIPTGPRNGNIPPTGPSSSVGAAATAATAATNAHRFSNQQRHLGKEEDNAYMRQPVNPHRHQNRQRRVRPSDYRELGA